MLFGVITVYKHQTVLCGLAYKRFRGPGRSLRVRARYPNVFYPVTPSHDLIPPQINSRHLNLTSELVLTEEQV